MITIKPPASASQGVPHKYPHDIDLRNFYNCDLTTWRLIWELSNVEPTLVEGIRRNYIRMEGHKTLVFAKRTGDFWQAIRIDFTFQDDKFIYKKAVATNSEDGARLRDIALPLIVGRI